MSKKLKIPINWESVTVGDLALRIHYGYTAKSTRKNTGIQMLRITDIQNYQVNWTNVPFCEIEQDDISKYLLEKGDIVFARTGATVGKSFMIKGIIPQAVFASYLIRIKLSNVILPQYLYYFFQTPHYWRQISSKAKGVGQPNVNATSLSKVNINLAPFNEQYRIVSKIETLFSELDQADKGLKKAKQQLKFYRQVILKNAFTNSAGKKSKLGDCVSKIGLRIKPDKKSKYKFIGLDSINPNSFKLHQIHEYSNFSSSGISFNKGDILYSRMRPNLNKVYKADFDGVCSGEFFVLKCSDSLDADFLKYLLHSADFVGYATNKAKGDRPRLSYSDFASYEINLMSKIKQERIVEDIDSKFSLIDNLENTINKSIKSIESTRNSILKQAFEGKLVLQEPTDESASELLKRIRVEKEKYLSEQIELKKKHPKKTVKMSKLLNIEDILKTSEKPMLAKDVWQNSKHKNDIESFYAELKELGEKVTEIKEGLNSLLILKQ